ncbi:hypothetical protein [Ferrimonas gelatinilytica]|uniref:Periplasmic protein n=1 Tax=Ferrimonas gelatinilytica TaxID=1255257 RepID=A0ABP9SGI4_9GAMM
MKKQICALAMLLGPLMAPASALELGQPLPYLTLDDQHGEAHTVSAELNALVFTRDKAASDVATEALTGVTPEQLAESGIVYVADISAMPAIITKMFAMPKMRKQSFLTLLDNQGAATANFPAEEGKVSVMRFEAGQFQGVEYLEDGDALRTRLGL